MGSFGEKFREERERRGFTLDDISNVTKINSRMLQAIEQEHFDVLPGGVFNKGFVRAYAKLLGFNDQEAVAGYLTALRQAQLDAQNAAWDQPPPRTPSAPIASAPSKQQVTASSKIGNSSSPSSDSPVPEPLVRVPFPAQSGSASVSSENGSGAVSNERPERESQVPPMVIAAPLWISPPLSSSAPAKSLPTPPPLVTPPVNVAQVPPVSVAESSTSVQTPQAESSSDVERLSPQILAEKPPGQQRSAIRSAPATVPMQRSSGAQWKAPLAILGLGVIIVGILLWGRHSRAASPTVTAPVAANASTSAMPPNLGAPPSITNAANTPPKAGGSNSSAEHADSSAASTSHAPPHSAAKKPQAPAPFRVAIRASENCWVSITADGELVARENLIAPATTSVKASHELVVQVSNPAGVSFRWNDRTISAESDSGTKTFVFDSNGLRSNP